MVCRLAHLFPPLEDNAAVREPHDTGPVGALSTPST